ncbi:MAG TPA: hypothetical protein VK492_13690 [Chitinophagaceae bacterium]|nr:hypothetical protein [Chitinophagaceae bacterium]
MTIIEEFKRNFVDEKTNKLHKGKIISSLIVISILIVFIVYKNKSLKFEAQDRSAHSMYTIGITGDKHHNFKSSKPTLIYYYKVSNRKYKSREHVGAKNENTAVPNGGRYYVLFSYKNPANSRLLLDFPVPDSIPSSPDIGWSYMPGYEKKNN